MRLTVSGYNYSNSALALANQNNACTGNGNPKVDIPRYYNYSIGMSVEQCALTIVAGLPTVGACTTLTPSRVQVVGTDGYRAEQTEIDVSVAENQLILVSTSSAFSQFTSTGCQTNPARPIYNMLDY